MNDFYAQQTSPIITLIYALVTIAFYIAFAYPMMKIGDKKGLTGWYAFVPILNLILLVQIIEKPLWWVVLFFVPCANIVICIYSYVLFLQAINKSALWILALFFCPPVFLVPLYQAASE